MGSATTTVETRARLGRCPVLACRRYGCFVANHWERDGQKWHFAKS